MGSSVGAAAAQYQQIYAFGSAPDADGVIGALSVGAGGALYGVTDTGGLHNHGAVFSLTPPATPDADWTESVIWSFKVQAYGQAGNPAMPGLAIDSSGNLYGATQVAGSTGEGTIFELSPASEGWNQSILWTFHGDDGAQPEAGLLRAPDGALYGTTSAGGSLSDGTTFKLRNGGRLETLYNFAGSPDGADPRGGLTPTPAGGALFGNTNSGGATGCGTVYELTFIAGVWQESPIFSFGAQPDGCNPQGNLVSDRNGVLYGTTNTGGSLGFGTVFSLTPPASPGGSWTEDVLYSFVGGTQSSDDGAYPSGGIVIGPRGVLYGTTRQGGGINDGYGAVYSVAPPVAPGGPWVETVLQAFQFPGSALSPQGPLTLHNGVLYGTTTNTVFSLIP